MLLPHLGHGDVVALRTDGFMERKRISGGQDLEQLFLRLRDICVLRHFEDGEDEDTRVGGVGGVRSLQHAEELCVERERGVMSEGGGDALSPLGRTNKLEYNADQI